MKKIITIIGARPQFIKAAVLSRLIRSNNWKDKFTEVLIHTGQHYDTNMSEVFFQQMRIPTPDINLNVGSASHGKMTGEMLIQIEKVLIAENPDILIVYGDTNSTLAGALAASKLNIPIAHIEAGLRSYWKKMPEEQNRILADNLSTWLFCPTETAVSNLKKEGINEGVICVGDIMLDASLYYQKEVNSSSYKKIRINNNSPFFLLTIHRAENTDDAISLNNIFKGLTSDNINGIFPIHPRTKKKMEEFNIKIPNNIIMINPIGYLEMIELQQNCKFIVTDSGGVQKEAYFMKKPCITLRNQTEWVETVDSGWNTLVGTNIDLIKHSIMSIKCPQEYSNIYGNGNAAEQILSALQ